MTPPGASKGIASLYLTAHCLLMLGYALLGKRFAYFGIPPVYVGEMVLALGMLAITLSPVRWTVFRSRQFAPLLALMAWGAARTIPYLSDYGILSLRDAAIWGYGIFAFLIASYLISSPATVSRLLDFFSKFVKIFLVLAPVIWLLSTVTDIFPFTPNGRVVPILKGGELMVHLAGAIAFISLRIRPVSTFWLVIAPLPFLLGLNTRGGILTFMVAVAVLFSFRLKMRRLLTTSLLFFVFLTVGGLLDIRIETPGMPREVSIRQVDESVRSIFFDTGSAQYDGTKRWRLQWWKKIVSYAVFGDYAWTGKGFGVNLSVDDGFILDPSHDLRSPHNGHLTFLARAGVPGFLLWILSQGTWVWQVMRCYKLSKANNDIGFSHICIFLLTYWTAFIVCAGFDVFLEGPMAGVWFWSLYGVGMACVILYRKSTVISQAIEWRGLHDGSSPVPA